MPENMMPMMLATVRVIFRLISVVLGSGAVVCLLASFSKPEFAGRAIVFLLGAIGLLYARDSTPKNG